MARAAKLDEAAIDTIKKSYASGSSVAELALSNGVSKPAIYNALKRGVRDANGVKKKAGRKAKGRVAGQATQQAKPRSIALKPANVSADEVGNSVNGLLVELIRENRQLRVQLAAAR